MKSFKWLHLSDFHVGKDEYGQIKLFRYILEHMSTEKDKGCIPDAVFITGDIANGGLEEQYNIFINEFLLKLLDIYENLENVYIVPGNHDLNRDKCSIAAKSLYEVLKDSPNFFDTNEKGKECREEIFPRFEGFKNFINSDYCFSAKKIFEEKGYFNNSVSKEGNKIGIVGINTAWLSKSDKDKENLTPGKYMLEEALESVEDCDYKLVLGHHPLSWLQGEQKQQITTLLAKSKAIYLHGHLHKNSGEYALNFNTGVLTLQCGAAFQARENEKYYNSLQWGEINFDDNTIRITPWKWSVNKQKFVADSAEWYPESFKEEGKDSWLFPCTIEFFGKSNQEKAKPQIKIPLGWNLIDKAFIEKRKEAEEQSILKYFDGKESSYSDVFSDYIPVRNIVLEIKDEFIRCNNNNQIKCTLVTGAGGEGKTTVLLQSIKILVEEEGWKALILRHAEKDMRLGEAQILNITKEGNWIICVDNCFPVAPAICELLKKVARQEQSHIHFLLCARDIDWNNTESHKLPWRNFSSYSTHKLRGINEDDAEKIVKAWENLGENGLGILKGLSTSEAKKRLVLASQNEERGDESEGALLGALLSTRYGQDLHNHVRDMLLRLQEIPLGNETLLDAFAYIVAMHSEKLRFLSKTVLAQIYREVKNIKKSILGPLGDEAASAVSGDIIYTRHISIAKSAREILDKEFQVDFDEIFINLATAAVEIQENGGFVEEYRRWKFISDNFFKKNKTLAINIDKRILKILSYDPYMIVHLSTLYRKAGQPQMALDLFRDVDFKIDHRSFFCEWALVEANEENRNTSVCLSALALSDKIESKPIDIDNACINLYSIALTFTELYALYKNDKYLFAARAAIELGRKIDPDNVQIKKLVNIKKDTLNKVQISEKGLNLQKYLKEGILIASADKEIIFKNWIPKVEDLEYKRVFMMAGIMQ